GGTIDMPADCPYNGEMAIIDGLPPATTIEIQASLTDFFNVVAIPGGSLGGEIVTFDAVMEIPMTGTGDLAGFNRNMIMPVSGEMHLAPRTPGDPVQTFDTDMFQLQGAIFGDPDFDFLQLTAGTAFGLPSPGQTTLTRLGPPGSDFQVESFFDIAYQIDFVGAPGSVLDGFSGSTQGNDLFEQGSCDQATGVATATDNCDPDVAITYADSFIGDCGLTGTITRTWTATDACGNSTSCVQMIAVEDNTPPAITCPPDATIECGCAGGGGDLTLYSVDQGSDLLREIDPNTAGNLNSIAMTLPGFGIIGANGLATHPVTQELWAIVRVAGGRRLVTVDPATGLCTDIGALSTGYAGLAFNADGSVLWGVTGDGGSPSESLFELDQTNASEMFLCTLGNGTDGETIGFNPANGILYHASGHFGAGLIFESIDNVGVDPCGVTNIPIGSPLNDEEAQAITWWGSENVFLWKQGHFPNGPLFRVETNGSAVLVGNMDHQAKGLAFVGGGCDTGVATATDVCDADVDVTYSDNFDGACGSSGFIARTWTATDDCGNSTSCVQFITIVDTSDPMISCPEDVTVECGDATDPSATGTATASDICGATSVDFADSFSPGCGNTGTITRVWTATDDCGNSTSCVQTITIEDTTPPQMTCIKPPPFFCMPFEITSTWLLQNEANYITAWDACDQDPTIEVVDSSDIDFGCSTTRTYLFTAVDACGNQGDTCSVIVQFLYDDEAPVVTCS
ncbi:MAG: hypothetical protein R3330_07120, partial [Saprospiraceae bacterium]|nr:hypothetical protein [Saprospiraceae bacterium]